MYPFLSPYLHLMRGPNAGPAPSLLSGLDVTGLGSARTPGIVAPASQPVDPFAPDADARRRARLQGLVGLGSALLESASSGDVAGGIGRGMQAFVAGREGSLDRDRALALARREEERRAAEEGRRVAAESRAAAQEIDRNAAADLDMQAGRAKMTAFEEDRARESARRTATGKSATAMVDEINALAAATPDDPTLARMAKRAAGYALGDDSDLGKLDSIYADMLAYSNRDEDAEWKREQGIEQAQAEARYGFGPIAEGRRAEEGLDLDRLRTHYYGRQTDKQMNRDPDVKPATWYDDVSKEIDRMMSTWMDGRKATVGKIFPQPDGTIKAGEPPTSAEIDAARREFETKAIESVNRRLGMHDEGRDVRSGNVHERPDPSTSTQATQVRNLVLQQIRAGDSREEILAQLRARGNRLYGYTPEQYLDNAMGILARRIANQGAGGGSR